MVQRLRLQASNAGGSDSVCGWGTKDPTCCGNTARRKKSNLKVAPGTLAVVQLPSRVRLFETP